MAEMGERAEMARPGKTALVHDWLTGMRGGEKVLIELAELFPQAPIYTLFHLPGTVGVLEERTIRTTYLQRLASAAGNYRYLLPLFPRAIESLDLSSYDLVLSVSHCVAKGAVRGEHATHICYCNTPMRYAWDQEKAYFPKQTGPVAAVRRQLLARLRRWDVRTADRVDHYIGNSSFVADRIARYYHREAAVVHPPVDVDFYCLDHKPSETTREPFALVVSALVPYKRIDLAIEACRLARTPLKIVGVGPERLRLESLAQGDVEFLGWRNAEELRSLYRRASVFLQPGIEDFGITPVEALACGCPVVALGKGGVLDIVEDGRHGILYEGAEDPEALATAIDKSGKVRFNFLDLRERATQFSRDKFRERISAQLERFNSRPGEAS